jgi:hypothetical protein
MKDGIYSPACPACRSLSPSASPTSPACALTGDSAAH